MDRIAKDVGDIQARLTDHRPVVQGELRYFVAEFEEKRGFRESRLLENLDKTVVETTEQVVPKCVESMKEQLCEVFERLEAANHMAQRIQQRELEAQESTHLQEFAERHKQDWEEFLKEQTVLKEQVDEEHAKAVSRLSAQYSVMKKELAKFSHF
ncbi:biogenesis of lysosome-related organelles complex 1 subunit 5 isoform X2 [Scleropages formosus]|uniref:biogenesis of lysosome-related organelles complex 1 subunit 5 isoform X2 n=1 Tax=Scleropages formosus TaxID=113540 RepID=UPI0008788B13|nr:biogenesis of lysosome-related organelles complex 1 subunit 5 isoform X2 [Scleropages formosus]